MTIPVNYSFTGKNDAIDITKPLLLSGIFEIFKQMIHSILGKKWEIPNGHISVLTVRNGLWQRRNAPVGVHQPPAIWNPTQKIDLPKIFI